MKYNETSKIGFFYTLLLLRKTHSDANSRERNDIIHQTKIVIMIRIRSFFFNEYNKSNGLRVVLEIGFFFFALPRLLCELFSHPCGENGKSYFHSSSQSLILKSLFTFGELCTPTVAVVCPKATRLRPASSGSYELYIYTWL
jgi:hypothetical protein